MKPPAPSAVLAVLAVLVVLAVLLAAPALAVDPRFPTLPDPKTAEAPKAPPPAPKDAKPAPPKPVVPNPAPRAEYLKRLDELVAARGKGSESERAKRLYDLAWKHQLEEAPELATNLGYPGENDRWSDRSFAAIERRRAEARELLKAVQSIDRGKLPAAERMDYDLFRRGLEEEIAGFRFPSELLAINQMGGIQQGVPNLFATTSSPACAACRPWSTRRSPASTRGWRAASRRRASPCATSPSK